MSAACGICDPCTCDDCNGTGECTFEDHTLPCPYCRPAAAREAAAIYDPPASPARD